MRAWKSLKAIYIIGMIQSKASLSTICVPVDSGNMVAYLWMAAKAIEDYINEPLLSDNYKLGLEDTITLASTEIRENFYEKPL